MSLRFHEARYEFFKQVSKALDLGLFPRGKVVVIRDIWGRLSLALEHKQPKPQKEQGDALTLCELEQRLKAAVGPYYGGEALFGADMFAPEHVFLSPDLHPCPEHVRLYFLERQVVGADWQREPITDMPPRVPRATLHGIKGGVGRSTALAAWARYLAEQGERVLIIDLDLESPGISSSLMSDDAGADFGVVDWFAEDAVENADDELLRRMAFVSPLGQGTPGEILLVPCGGRQAGTELEYLAKLSRVYQDLAPREQTDSLPRPMQFADRLAYMIDELERYHRPTVVLIDSRAGIHDIAAVTITRLCATAFLFLIGTKQTFDGYRLLFQQWQSTSIGEKVRQRLQVVAAQVPRVGRSEYLSRFQQDSWNLFSQTLYEQQNDGDKSETSRSFHYDIHDPAGPHSPPVIYWSDAVQQWNPLANYPNGPYELPVDVKIALHNFLERATELVFSSSERDNECP